MQQPLEGITVVDLSRYLPGPFATRELLRLGARVVHVEAPGGDPMREFDAAWFEALNAGKESVVCDLKTEPALGQALCAAADVVVEGFRPGVAKRMGLEPGPGTVWCSITGFGQDGPHAGRAGHDLNYEGWAGVLATAPALPPLPFSDFAGAFAAVREILAALLVRGRTGEGARIDVSLTDEVHRLGPVPRVITGAAACYRIYRTADGRFLTVAALEPHFWERLCELVELPELSGRGRERALPQLEARLAERTLAEWLRLFDGEDVCVGPVALPAELAPPPGVEAAALGEHTEAWRRELAA